MLDEILGRFFPDHGKAPQTVNEASSYVLMQTFSLQISTMSDEKSGDLWVGLVGALGSSSLFGPKSRQLVLNALYNKILPMFPDHALFNAAVLVQVAMTYIFEDTSKAVDIAKQSLVFIHKARRTGKRVADVNDWHSKALDVLAGPWSPLALHEQKKHIDYAFDILKKISDPNEIAAGVFASTNVTKIYVRFYLKFEGSSSRLRKLFEKNLNRNEELLGSGHRYTYEARRNLARYLISTHDFARAIPHARKVFEGPDDGLADCGFEVGFDLLIESLWGNRNMKEAIQVCEDAIAFGCEYYKRTGDDVYLEKWREWKEMMLRGEEYLYEKPKKAEVKVDRKKYETMKNVAELRVCAHCGCREGELKLCSGCKRVFYCSRRHQKLHWKAEHKNACKQVA